MWGFPEIGVAPKSSTLMRFSIKQIIHLGVPPWLWKPYETLIWPPPVQDTKVRKKTSILMAIDVRWRVIVLLGKTIKQKQWGFTKNHSSCGIISYTKLYPIWTPKLSQTLANWWITQETVWIQHVFGVRVITLGSFLEMAMETRYFSSLQEVGEAWHSGTVSSSLSPLCFYTSFIDRVLL